MTYVLPVTEARKNLLNLVDRVDEEYTRVDLTKKGKVKKKIFPPPTHRVRITATGKIISSIFITQISCLKSRQGALQFAPKINFIIKKLVKSGF